MRTVVLAALSASLPFELREAVRDWTAAGLLTDTMWVDADGVTDGVGDVPVLGVRPGAPDRVVGLQTELAQSSTDRVRLVSVQVVGDTAAQVPVATIQRLQDVMMRSGVRVVRLNVLLRTDAARTAQPAPVVISTPNVVVQPADGLSSTAPAATIGRGAPNFVAHCTGALATVAGLWAGQEAGPYDDDPTWVSDQAEMVRWYRRAVDGAAVWDGLRSSLVPGDRLPVAVDSGGQPLEVVPAPAVPGIVAKALDTLLASTSSLTAEASLEPFVRPPRKKVGFGEALAEFFAFVVSSLRNAPARWLRTAQHDFSSALAERATTALYGTGGGVEVVVNGQVPRRRGGGEDIAALTQVVANVASDLSQQIAVPPPTREFADAFCHTATALLDGGERRDLAIELPHRGVAPVVIGSADAVAPDPTAPPFVVRAELGLPSDDAVVTSWSPYSALRVEAQLRAAEEQEVRSGGRNAGLLAGIQDARAGLNRWVGQQNSLTWNLLLTLARRLDQSRVQLNDVIAQARSAQQVDGPSEELLRREKAERRTLRLVVLLVLPLVIVAVVLCFLFAPLTVALIVLGVLVIGWMSLLVSRYLALKSIAWQMIHQRDEARARREWAERQVLKATYDVFRLGVAYGCASAWSRVIGSVLHRPFGAGDAAGSAASPGPVDTPLEMRSATGEFDRRAMAEVINRVQRQVLGGGWLGDELRRRIGDIAEMRRRDAGWDHPQQILDDPGIDGARELQAAAVLVEDPAIQGRARSEFDVRVDGAVERFQAERGPEWALQTIRIADTGGVAAGDTAAQFLAPILGRAEIRLPDIGFSEAGTMERAATVEDSPVFTTAGSGGSSLPGGAGATGGGGTPFDRTAVRLDRGRRTHPAQLGVGSDVAPPPPPPTPSVPTVEPDF